jgi:hypothetical protein
MNSLRDELSQITTLIEHAANVDDEDLANYLIDIIARRSKVLDEKIRELEELHGIPPADSIDWDKFMDNI